MQEYNGLIILDCPWCESLSVCFTEIGNWECFRCGEHGHVTDFEAIYPLVKKLDVMNNE
jgi:ribosomal protein L37AE/L43A